MDEEMNKLVTLPYVSSAFNFRSFTKIVGDKCVCQFRTDISGLLGRRIHGPQDFLRSTLIRIESVLDFSEIFGLCPSQSRTSHFFGSVPSCPQRNLLVLDRSVVVRGSMN